MQVRQRLDFLKESVTARRTYDGPSCTSVTTFKESFPVPNSQELKCFETVDHDGSSCLWRSVLQVRHRVQRVDFSTQISEFLSVLGRDTLDGPSCPWRSVVGSVVSACFSKNKICCSKRLNRSLHKETKRKYYDCNSTWFEFKFSITTSYILLYLFPFN